MHAHPIPQNVVSFEDRIFGPFTAKQFSIMAAGLSLSFVLYMSPLPNNLKLPIIIPVALISIAAGLVKINGMTLDVWLMTFFAAVYAPTQFIWQKEPDISFLKLKNPNPTKKSRKTTSNQRVQKVKQDFYPDLFGSEEQDEKESHFIASLNFNIPTYMNPLQEELATTITPLSTKTLPFNKEQTSEKPFFFPEPEKNISADLGKRVSEKETVHAISQPEEITMMKEKELPLKGPVAPVQETEALPLKKRVSVQTKGVKNPIASEINFVNQPTFSIQISGQEPQYVEGISNLKINRALSKAKMKAKELIYPILGEKHFEVSPELEKRFKNDDMEVKNLEVMKIDNEKVSEKFPPKPLPQLPQKPKLEPNSTLKGTPLETTSPLLNKEVPFPQKEIEKPLTPEPQKKAILPIPPSIVNTPPVLSKEEKKIPIIKNREENSTLPLVNEVKIPPPYPQTTLKPKPLSPSVPVEQKIRQQQVIMKQVMPSLGNRMTQVSPPQIPNIISGFIKTTKEAVLTNVIVIIKDKTGNPVRALKSNKLGQFSIATPLPNGLYKLEFEKEGCQFNGIDLELKGAVVPPLRIIGTPN